MSFIDSLILLPRTNNTTTMQNISLTENVKEIINKLRIVAADSDACEIYRNSIGWQYGGYKIEAQLNHLKDELEKKKKKKKSNNVSGALFLT